MVTDVGLFGGGVFAGSQPFEVTAPLQGALLAETAEAGLAARTAGGGSDGLMCDGCAVPGATGGTVPTLLWPGSGCTLATLPPWDDPGGGGSEVLI